MVDGLWTGKKNEGAKNKKRSYKTIDIVSYALKVSENGVAFHIPGSPFQVIRHI